MSRLFFVALILPALIAGAAQGQCTLANPSFEIEDPGAPTFSGWNQFGITGSTTDAVHGQLAAKVTGPSLGGWDVSGFIQDHDAAPGEQFAVTGHFLVSGTAPLKGASLAIVNVEWHDAGGMMDYQSFDVGDAGTPFDEYFAFSFTSDPAPAGTTWIRLLLGVLQEPGGAAPTVLYDQVTLYSTGPPTQDEIQWGDFPSGRTVAFAGRDWRVKGPGLYGPGSNLFAHTADHVWVDADGALHLTLKQAGGNWYATEVVLDEALGYGDYVVTTKGRLDLLDLRAILGIFLWEYGPCYADAYRYWNPWNEIDIEYGRWGDSNRPLGQFVAQPWEWAGNMSQFEPPVPDDKILSHAMRWLPDRVEYRVWEGNAFDESPATLVHAWTYTGPHVPRPEQPRLHLNLWRLPPDPPATDQEIVFTDFRFFAPDGVSAVGGDRPGPVPGAPAGRLFPVAPNPFNPSTRVGYALDRPGEISLAVYAADGRLVRTLWSGWRGAGDFTAVWDGRDDAGRPAASGVYLVRLKGADFVQTRRAVLVK